MPAPTDVDPQASPAPSAGVDGAPPTTGPGPRPLAPPPTTGPQPAPGSPLGRALATAALTTAAVTALSWIAPEKYAATLVGLAFLGATWLLVLRRDETTIRAHGLSLGGLLEPVELAPSRLARAALVALGWAALCAALAFPPFFFGYKAYYAGEIVRITHDVAHFHLRLPASLLDELSGQLLVIALPEEAFFRGYLQSALDRSFAVTWRVLGAELGPGWLISAAIFAVGHYLTSPHPGRLAVFFPALLFGWLRARTRGIGAGVVFHASCNLFSAALGRGFGLSP